MFWELVNWAGPSKDLRTARHLSKRLRNQLARAGEREAWRSVRLWIGLALMGAILLLGAALGGSLCVEVGILIPALLLIQYFCVTPAYERGVEQFLTIHAPHGRLLRCPECDYDLQGTSTGTCPECGTWVRVDQLMVEAMTRE